MADTISPEARSRNMAAIRSRDTEPEIYIRKNLFARGLRYRKNAATVPGHPDLYFAKYRTALLVNGCFWHRHKGCKYAYTPKSRVEFWQAKFAHNTERDQKVKDELNGLKIRCLIIWECTIRKMKKDTVLNDAVLDQIISFLNSSESFLEI